MTNTPAPHRVPFRPHRLLDHARLAGFRGIFGQLNTEWLTINDLPYNRLEVQTYAEMDPTLNGYGSGNALLDGIDTSDADEADRILLGLLRAYQAGHTYAGRILLQAMLPKLSRNSLYAITDLTSDAATNTEERRLVTLAAFWELLDRCPAATGTRVASWLGLSTLRVITTGNSRRAFCSPTDSTEVLDAASSQAQFDPTATAALERELTNSVHRARTAPLDLRPGDLAFLQQMGTEVIAELGASLDAAHGMLDWAVACDVISGDDGNFLREVYLSGTSIADATAVAADRRGISMPTARQRCSRARRAVATAVSTYADGGTPSPKRCVNRHAGPAGHSVATTVSLAA